MRSFALLGLALLLCSCAEAPQVCTDAGDYTQAVGLWRGREIMLKADGYTGASGGKFVIDGVEYPLGPELELKFECSTGRHEVLLEVYVEDQMLCERGFFYCRRSR